MRNNSILKLIIVILVIATCAVLAYNKVSNDTIRTGIDIRGGVSAILEPDIAKGSLSDQDIDKGLNHKNNSWKRLDAKNIRIEV